MLEIDSISVVEMVTAGHAGHPPKILRLHVADPKFVGAHLRVLTVIADEVGKATFELEQKQTQTLSISIDS